MNSALQEIEREQQHRLESKIKTYYPDAGPLRRELYAKHLLFFRLGKDYRERMAMMSNRSGKTTAGSYELALHATGRYDQYAPWWQGRRFVKPVSIIAAGETNLTTRDIIQAKTLGRVARQPGDNLREAYGLGTGMIPKDAIIRPTPRRGAEDAYESVTIRHISGGSSEIKFRSYEQGREAFQGVEADVVWLDEEAPYEVYSEALTRLMTTNGIMMLTFTPLRGVTPLVREFMEKADREA